MTDHEPTETTEATDAGHGPDCPLYGQYNSEPSEAVKASVRTGTLLTMFGGLIGVAGSVAGRIYWLGKLSMDQKAAAGDGEALKQVANDMYAAWLPFVVLPMLVGGVLTLIGIWQMTVAGSAPDRGSASARAISRVMLLAIPYAIVASFLYRDVAQMNTAGEWFFFTGFVIVLGVLTLSLARHLDNILASVGADGRLVPQLFYFTVLVATALGLQQNPAEPRFSGLFAAGIGVAMFFGILTLMKVRTEMTGVAQDEL